ncbi:hypothetical protein KEF29_03285 [Streptomyces tuirus]|uniref:Uncharacterized protein n=1 Tax=Streptomyces tuirus TaxID=68278 RepID=A0A941FEN6_9ACTN|nr:hypothetical protein [Streptomyces tuirus]
MSPFLFSADLAVTDLGRHARATTTVDQAMADLFGDDFSRALHRETAYAVPDSERLTCPVHQDWRSHCLPLHVARPAAA